MQLQSFIQSNITFLYQEPLNHLHIDLQKIEKHIQKEGKSEQNLHNRFEVPGNLKVLSYPGRKIDIVFEQNRILINDNSGKKDNHEFLTYIDTTFQYGKIDEAKISSYGFNIVAEAKDDKHKSLINQNIVKTLNVDIEKQGILFTFLKNNVRYQIQVNPQGSNHYTYSVHCNAHYSGNKISDKKKLEAELKRHISYFEELVTKL